MSLSLRNNMLLYHYFDKKTGPFRNLSDLSEKDKIELYNSFMMEQSDWLLLLLTI